MIPVSKEEAIQGVLFAKLETYAGHLREQCQSGGTRASLGSCAKWGSVYRHLESIDAISTGEIRPSTQGGGAWHKNRQLFRRPT